MTTLFFDLGNTRVKWWNGEKTGILPYDELGKGLNHLICADQPVSNIVFSSVVKDERKTLFEAQAARSATKALHECVVTPVAVGVECAYKDVDRLGVDRWLAVVAAWHQLKGAALVVDLGTAATLDMLEPPGRHLGGFIIPGLKLGLTGLLAGTNNIIVDQDQLQSASRQPGTTTNEAVYHGALAAMTATIETSLNRLRRANPDAKLLLTGGDAQLVGDHLDCEYQLQPDLVFVGMKLLYEHGLTQRKSI